MSKQTPLTRLNESSKEWKQAYNTALYKKGNKQLAKKKNTGLLV
jgi:hypothetical protein